MKLFNLKSALVATALMTSASASAGYVHFDADGTGATSTAEAIAKLNLTATTIEDSIVQDLGVDGIMNNGDTFTESLSFRADSAIFLSGFESLINSNGSNGFYTVSMELVGHIDNFVQFTDNTFTSTETPSITTDNTTWSAIQHSIFDVVFDFADAAVKLEWNNTDTNSVSTVGVWDVLGGGADQVGPSTGVQDFALLMAFDSGTNDDYFKDSFGNAVSEYITINQAFSTGAGSANPTGIAGTSGNTLTINSSSNNAAMRFDVPEPTSLAILGLGLLGLAGARRRA